MILCRTLGPVELSVDGGPAPPELLWRKHLALLIYLARSPRRGRTREHLIGLLWGDRTEAAARHSLSEALRVIRHHAGEGSVEVTVGQVRLETASVQLDVDRLEEAASAGDWVAAAELVSGEFLEGFALAEASEFEDWLAAERGIWGRRGVEVLVSCAEAHAQVGKVEEAGGFAVRALGLQPMSESALRCAVRCRSLAGDRAGALALFEEFQSRLAAEIGVEPSEETRSLMQRVRRERAPRAETLGGHVDDSPVVRPPLEGRGPELQRLLEASAGSALARRVTLLVLEGDAGMGKTRLLDEFLARLRLDGTPVVAARAVEADRAEPWSGVLALARGGLLEAPGVGASPSAALAAFAAVLPEWAERFSGAAALATPHPLGRALAEALRAAVEEQPVVIAVDDAQWLDQDSALSLGAVLRDLTATPLTLVLAIAPYPPRPELDELRVKIGSELGGQTVRLRVLDRAGLRHLAERMLPGYDPVAIDRVVRRVATDSAGLPLLAVELLRAVALGLDLGTLAGTWPEPFRTLDQSLPGHLPDAVVAAIRIGVRRLSPAAQRVLTASAVLGDLVPPALLERALSLETEDVGRALDELEWHRWLVAEPRGYSFVARIVRQVVERDIVTPGQRRRVLEAVDQIPASQGGSLHRDTAPSRRRLPR
ncbi:MAG TPA: AAA family ATPase [Gemmatimonadales bacterium]|nr:AAA family ATPase [Gemmatimonadales bacterium]